MKYNLGDIVYYKDCQGFINKAVIEQVLPNNITFIVKVIGSPYESFIHKKNIVSSIRFGNIKEVKK